MKINEALHMLKNKISFMQSHYDVLHLSIFGSVARNEAGPKSDIDILVEFNKPTFDNFMELKFFLEDLLHRNVDLVTKDSLKPRLKSFIEKESIHVA